MDVDPSTLTRYILAQQRLHKEATGDLTLLVSAIATACKAISSAVRRAGLTNLLGYHGASNVSGDEQKKLDVISNDIFKNLIASTGVVGVMVSEEDEEAVLLPEAGERGKYVVVFDPLDGSSNIDCNVSVGSIFGVFRRDTSRPPSAADALQKGTALVCAGYAAYGSSTQICVAFTDDLAEKRGVNVFTLDPSIGEFLLSHKAVKLPAAPQRIYSCNEVSLLSFPPFVQRFVAECKGGEKPNSLRYVGSMVADVHRTLLYGGCFVYSATAASPAGKLRLLYEGAPMAFILEAAGGRALTGLSAGGRVLDVVPLKLHERVPVLLGSPRDIDRLEALRAEA